MLTVRFRIPAGRIEESEALLYPVPRSPKVTSAKPPAPYDPDPNPEQNRTGPEAATWYGTKARDVNPWDGVYKVRVV